MTTALDRPPTTSVDEVLGTIRSDAESRYRELVSTLAAEQAIDGDELVRCMARTGRTDDDLKRHVADAQARQAALADLLAMPAARERVESLHATAGDVQARVDSEVAALRERIAALESECKAAKESHRAAMVEVNDIERKARETLRRTSRPDSWQRVNDSNAASHAAGETYQKALAAVGEYPPLAVRLSRAEDAVAQLEAAAQHSFSLGEAASVAGRLEAARATLSQLTEQRDELARLKQDADAARAAAERIADEVLTDPANLRLD
jgi:hypothetical protein